MMHSSLPKMPAGIKGTNLERIKALEREYRGLCNTKTDCAQKIMIVKLLNIIANKYEKKQQGSARIEKLSKQSKSLENKLVRLVEREEIEKREARQKQAKERTLERLKKTKSKYQDQIRTIGIQWDKQQEQLCNQRAIVDQYQAEGLEVRLQAITRELEDYELSQSERSERLKQKHEEKCSVLLQAINKERLALKARLDIFNTINKRHVQQLIEIQEKVKNTQHELSQIKDEHEESKLALITK